MWTRIVRRQRKHPMRDRQRILGEACCEQLAQLIVETLGKNGMKLTERILLTDNGNTLQRRITFRSKKLEEESIVQEFDRVD